MTTDAAGSIGAVEAAALGDIGAWRRGELIWVNAPVRDIIADLNRYSDHKIALFDAAAADQLYTLVLQTSETEKAVSLIAQTLDLTIDRRPNGDIVLR